MKSYKKCQQGEYKSEPGKSRHIIKETRNKNQIKILTHEQKSHFKKSNKTKEKAEDLPIKATDKTQLTKVG